MNKNRLSFHTAKTRTLLSIVFFCLFLSGLEYSLILSSNNSFTEINTLINSQYEYSVVMNSSQGNDDYYQYDAAIRFALSTDSDSALKVDVIMQPSSSEYSNIVYWNAEQLNIHEIAITQNIATAYELDIGDILYSKHIVDSNIYEYSIKQILPNTTNVRYENNMVHNDGMIIMGYDPMYEENISHSVIVFTNNQIDELTQNGKVAAEKILYRDDELLFAVKDVLPYMLLFFVLNTVGCIGFVLIRTKEISTNFRRFVYLGYEPDTINTTYNRFIQLPGCLVELGFVIANTLLCITCTLCLSATLFLLLINTI